MTKPHVAVEQIPPVLKSIPHWVCWKYIERAGKKTKCPVNAVHGWNASSTDPNSWCTFDEALATFQKSDTLAGIGFVFSADDPILRLGGTGSPREKEIARRSSSAILFASSHFSTGKAVGPAVKPGDEIGPSDAAQPTRVG